MSDVTIIEEPLSQFLPVYNDIAYVVDSADKNKDNFKYVAKVFVPPSAPTPAFTLKLYPNNINGEGIFKLNRSLENYLSYDYLFGSNNLINNCPNSAKTFAVGFGIEYTQYTTGNTIQYVYTADNDLVYSTGDTKVIWNAAFQYEDDTYLKDYSDYVLTDNTSKFLTNRSDNLYIDLGSEDWLYFLNLTSTPSLKVTVTYKDNTQGVWVKYGTSSALMQGVGVGPQNLNSEDDWDVFPVSSDSRMIINSNTVSYAVEMVDGVNTGTTISEIKTYYVKENAYKQKYKPVRISWLNKLGGFDALSFNLRNIYSVDVQRSQYSRLIDYNYSIGDRGTTILDIKAKESFLLNSDFLKKEETISIDEIYTSPVIYQNSINFPICVTLNDNDQLYTTRGYEEYTISTGYTVYYDYNGLGVTDTPDELLVTTKWNGYPDPIIIDNTGTSLTGQIYRKKGIDYIPKYYPIVMKDLFYSKQDGISPRNYRYEINFERAYKINNQRGGQI